MAMLTCAECGNEASTSAKACPQCGASRKAMRRRPRKPMDKWTLLGLLVLALCFIVGMTYENTRPPPVKSAAEQKEDHEEYVRIEMAKAAIGELQGSLRNPDSLVFEKILSSDDGGVTCIAYRAQNGFGGMNRDILVVTDKGSFTSASAWHKHCAHRPMYNYTDTLPMMIKMTG